MANIVVEPQKLRDTADQITKYVKIHKDGMQQINNVFNNMRSCEVGEEFDFLQQKWTKANESGSTSQEMLNKLECYAAYLSSCAKNYEIAQYNAQNRASWI